MIIILVVTKIGTRFLPEPFDSSGSGEQVSDNKDRQ